jgi:hypothetical protein
MNFHSNFCLSLTGNSLAPVVVSLYLDENLVAEHNFMNSTECELNVQFADTDTCTHCATLVMQGKTNNDNFNSFLISVDRATIDYVDITEFFNSTGLPYYHYSNGYSERTKELFGGHMGCDGKIMFTFATPIYKWLPGIVKLNKGHG